MLIDSHAHLDLKEFDKDRPQVIERAMSGGVSHIVSIGIDLESSEAAIRLAHKYPSVSPTVGIHPHSADEGTPQTLDRLAQIASENRVVGWGEIGLDYYRNYAPKEKQLETFKNQLQLARELNLPVIIHDREAHDDILRILKETGRGEKMGVIHCYSGDVSLAMEFIGMGYFISIPGTVTYKKATIVKEVAKAVPLERLMIETDAPFLAPVPKRGKRNEPLFVKYTAEEIARLRNTDVEIIAEATKMNTQELFNLP